MSIAVMTSSTALTKFVESKVPSARMNFSRFSDARLHELLSRLMYSEHGFDALIRPVSRLVCQSLIVSSYWMPGSAHSHAACVTLRKRVLASTVSMTEPSMRARRPKSVPSSTARMNSSETATEEMRITAFIIGKVQRAGDLVANPDELRFQRNGPFTIAQLMAQTVIAQHLRESGRPLHRRLVPEHLHRSTRRRVIDQA